MKDEPTSNETPKCIAIFDSGVTNSRDLIRGLGALMGDLAASRVVPGRANAICNAAGKILTTVNLEYKFGLKEGDGVPNLSLTMDATAGPTPKLPPKGTTTGRFEPARVRAK